MEGINIETYIKDNTIGYNEDFTTAFESDLLYYCNEILNWETTVLSSGCIRLGLHQYASDDFEEDILNIILLSVKTINKNDAKKKRTTFGKNLELAAGLSSYTTPKISLLEEKTESKISICLYLIWDDEKKETFFKTLDYLAGTSSLYKQDYQELMTIFDKELKEESLKKVKRITEKYVLQYDSLLETETTNNPILFFKLMIQLHKLVKDIV